MREIKFRAWDKRNKCFDYMPIILHGKVHILDSFDQLVETDQELQQFTGLKDRNGKEIYEGDKLFAPSNLTDDLQYVGDVVWDADDARWEVHNFHGQFEYIPPSGCVIGGHIYEQEAAADA